MKNSFLRSFLLQASACVFLLFQSCEPNETLLDPFPFFTASESGFWEKCEPSPTAVAPSPNLSLTLPSPIEGQGDSSPLTSILSPNGRGSFAVRERGSPSEDSAPPKTSISVCAEPNPVHRGQTLNISFYVPTRVLVKIAIFDEKGRRVREVFNEKVEGSASATWDLLDSDNVRVLPGGYRGFLVAGDFESHGDIIVK